MIHWLKAILRRALIASLKIEVAGDVTASSRIVYIANHRSFLDGLILSLFLPRSPLAIVNSEEVKSWWRRALYCAVPHAIIDVRKPTALRALARIGDRSLVMFAEATHGDSFAAKKIYAVPAVFAAQCGAAIVTVHVSRREIRLYPALSWTKPASGSGKERRRQAVSQLRALMEETIAASAPRVTVFEALVDAAAVSGRRTRIVEDMRSETPQSYGQLLKTSLALGRWMSRFTREGEIVGILIPNLITTVGALLGAMAASRTPAMLNYTAGVAGIKNACLAANVKCIVTSRKFLAV
ncbi:MAG: 1-acyl-sn-glycerol-3-phosphate acyltransferase, partial [Burkholderiales bacterium]